METWKPVLGYEELYEVSDLGNVRRISRGKRIDAAKMPIAKEMLANGATLKTVAEFLGVSITTVQSIKTGKTWAGNPQFRPVKPRPNKQHYLQVCFTKNGEVTQLRLHRVIWEAFNGPIPGRLEVNHKNLNRSDNRLENLELLTHRENVQHAFDIYVREQAGQPKRGPGSPRGRYFKHS